MVVDFSQFQSGPVVGSKTYPTQSLVGVKASVLLFDEHQEPLYGTVVRNDCDGYSRSLIVRLDDGRFVTGTELRSVCFITTSDATAVPQSDTLAKLSADAMLARTRELELTERIAALEKRLEAHTSDHGASEGFTTQVNQRLANLERWREGADKWLGEIEEYTKETREVTTANVHKLHGQCENTLRSTQRNFADSRRALHEVDEQYDKQMRGLRGECSEAFKAIKNLDARLAKIEDLPVSTRSKSGERVDHTVKELAESNIDADDVSVLVTDPDVAKEIASDRYFTASPAVRLKLLLHYNHFHAFAEVAIGCVQCERCGLELEDYQRSMLTGDMRTLCPRVPLSKDKAIANLQMWAVHHGHTFVYVLSQHTMACGYCGQRQDNYECVASCTLDMCPKQPQGDERFVREKKSP